MAGEEFKRNKQDCLISLQFCSIFIMKWLDRVENELGLRSKPTVFILSVLPSQETLTSKCQKMVVGSPAPQLPGKCDMQEQPE